MTSKIIEIFNDEIVPKLESVTGVSFLKGHLMYYERDLKEKRNGIGFPCLSASLGDDVEISLHPTLVQGKVDKQLIIIGAEEIGDRTTLDERLHNMAHEVRKVLTVNFFEEKSLANSFKVGLTKYPEPEANDAYALFHMTIIVNYLEDWS